MTPLGIRLLKKVEMTTPPNRPDLGLCWSWVGSLDSHGYGRVCVNYRMRIAHRVAYELIVGPIAPGLELDHLCRNRACINPRHLETVTCAENLRRGMHPNFVAHRTNICKRGHALTSDNVIVWVRPNGSKSRSCRTCSRAACRLRARARRAAARAARELNPAIAPGGDGR